MAYHHPKIIIIMAAMLVQLIEGNYEIKNIIVYLSYIYIGIYLDFHYKKHWCNQHDYILF